MMRMQPEQNNGVSQTLNDFIASQSHLQALNRRLIEVLGDKYAINLDDPHDFDLEGKPYTRFAIRCLYFTHNDKGYDEDPHGWIGVGHSDGEIISGCWVCERFQVVKHQGEWQPAPQRPTLH
jgi:hypothetical protein